MKHIRDDLKRKYPGLWERAYEKKQRAAAVRLFCLECMGDCQAEVSRCSEKSCPLYCFRTGNRVAGAARGVDEGQNEEKTAQNPSEQRNAVTEAVETAGDICILKTLDPLEE
jgi:hypothetical protein